MDTRTLCFSQIGSSFSNVGDPFSNIGRKDGANSSTSYPVISGGEMAFSASTLNKASDGPVWGHANHVLGKMCLLKGKLITHQKYVK
jgi:hypothetical protein